MLKLDGMVLRALLVLSVLSALLFAGHRYLKTVEQRGYDRAVSDGQKARQRATDQAQKDSDDLRALLALEQEQRFKESQAHAKNIADLQAAARAGVVRMRCPAAGQVPIPSTPANPPIAAGTEPADGPELVPEASATLFGIAGDIAEVVRQRNALIFRYNEVRATCNGASRVDDPHTAAQGSQ